jgi:RNA polymerase sigma factor (sigma-70 family)
MPRENLLPLVEQALSGDRSAVERLIQAIQGLVYNLCVRFFWNPADAEDACQEILVRILLRIPTFEGRSSFQTWAYQVASRYLINAKRSEAELLRFEEGAAHLAAGLSRPAYEGPDAALLEEEVKLSCTTSMLVCLSRPLRLACLMGEILEFDGPEGARILEIEEAAFRKRLSLARKKIRAFMGSQCGLYRPENPCRCAKQITYSIESGWFDPQKPNFAGKGSYQMPLGQARQEIERLMDEVAVFHSHPQYRTPERITEGIRSLIRSGHYRFLS